LLNLKHITAVLLCFVVTAGFPNIGAARGVSMVTVEWAPHYGSNLPENGLMTALTTAAFKAGGHDASIEFIPWPRALKEVEAGSANDFIPSN
jgi:polar amino acid transport system substrate-binding protein